MQHTAAMGVGDRIADIVEPAQELAKLDLPLRIRAARRLAARLVVALDRFGQAVAADETHGIERSAVAVRTEPVDGDDPGVFEAAGDLGFQDETRAVALVVCMPLLDRFERDIAIQLFIAGQEHFAEPAAGVGPEDAKSQPAGGRRAGTSRSAGRLCGVRIGDLGLCCPQIGQSGVYIWVRDLVQVAPDCAGRADRGQTLLRIIAVLLDVGGDHRLQELPMLGAQGLLLVQEPRERLGLVEHPGVHGGDQLSAADEVHLQSEDAEQQVTVGGSGHGLSSARGGERRFPDGNCSAPICQEKSLKISCRTGLGRVAPGLTPWRSHRSGRAQLRSGRAQLNGSRGCRDTTGRNGRGAAGRGPKGGWRSRKRD